MITVTIVDDHPLAREGLKQALGRDRQIRIVGEARSGAELEAGLNPVPDVLILDIHMPEFKAERDIPQHRERYPEMKIVIVTASHDGTLVRRLMEDVDGYLLKSDDVDVYARVVREVCRSRKSFSRQAMDLALNAPKLPALTKRELEVLSLAARGFKSAQIAEELHLSERTVASHLATAGEKLGVCGRTAAVAQAIELGLVSTGTSEDRAPY